MQSINPGGIIWQQVAHEGIRVGHQVSDRHNKKSCSWLGVRWLEEQLIPKRAQMSSDGSTVLPAEHTIEWKKSGIKYLEHAPLHVSDLRHQHKPAQVQICLVIAAFRTTERHKKKRDMCMWVCVRAITEQNKLSALMVPSSSLCQLKCFWFGQVQNETSNTERSPNKKLKKERQIHSFVTRCYNLDEHTLCS